MAAGWQGFDLPPVGEWCLVTRAVDFCIPQRLLVHHQPWPSECHMASRDDAACGSHTQGGGKRLMPCMWRPPVGVVRWSTMSDSQTGLMPAGARSGVVV
jgi:hypothetical protein